MKNNKKRTAPPQKTAEKRSVEGSAVGSKRYHTLGDLLQNPAVLEPRKAIIPRLMWHGTRTAFASREKLGKSTLVAKGVAEVSKGGSFLGEHCEEASLIWVNLEEPVPEMVQRFHGFDGHHNRIIIINYLELDWTKHIAEIAVETGAVGVVIDSYAMLLAHCGVTKENDSGLANAKIIAPLTRLTRKTGLGVTLIAHARKSDGTYRGATALGAGVDQLIEMFSSATGKNHRKFSTKGRWHLEDFEVSFDGKGYELTQGELPLETRIASLIQACPNSTVRSIRDAVGGKNETVQTALRKLEDEGTIHDYGNAQKSAYRMTEDQTEPDMGTSNGSPESSLETRTEPLRFPSPNPRVWIREPHARRWMMSMPPTRCPTHTVRSRKRIMHDAEVARRICDNIARQVQQMAPLGIGRWEPAWEIVASASAEFMIALCAWEQSPSEILEAQVRYWGDEVMARWHEAIQKFEEAHHAK